MVRVPLGGRRVAGYVTSLEEGSSVGLKELAAVSGQAPVFDAALAEVMRWAARHYAAPVSTMLGRCAPPNLPPAAGRPPGSPVPEPGEHPLVGVVSSGRHRPVVWLDSADPARWIRPVASTLISSGRSLLVVVPTGEEVASIAHGLSEFGDRLVVVDHQTDDAAVTAAWGRAHHHGGVIIGTPRVAAWNVLAPGAFAVVEESRRAMKDRATPTVHVRDLVLRRAARAGVPALFAGPAPSLEIVGRGADILRPPGRVWPLVEVVDRRDDPPGSGLLSERTRQAVQIAANQGGPVFLFAHRRGYSAASRCGRCRALRRCPGCGSRPDPEPTCRRCGHVLGPCVECGGARFEPLGSGVGRLVDEARRVVGRELVAEHPTNLPVIVGTERDLTTLALCRLVVLVDIDGLIFGADYRAAEEAFRLATRLAGQVDPGSGRRLIVQTNGPEHPVLVALRRADPTVFHEAELAVRRAMGYPPYGALLVIEARGEAAAAADAEIQAIAGDAAVLGPAPSQTGVRWLVQGSDLTTFKAALRPVLQRLRDSGLAVRVDVDPIDL
jgi:primosomal protein N' (replication factor Y) (superfamily II helicase)